ncbi:MAG: YkgJ family cysteine cluster protein [Desulfatibacillaceae bacterium]
MTLDFTPFFEEYEKLLAETDKVFAAIEEKFPDCVKCEIGCDDCCHAMFDLTVVEALYINHHFNRLVPETEKGAILERANRADRKAYQVKKEAFQASAKGKDTDEVLSRVAWERVRCPLLDDEGKCLLYEYRPATCRLYGIPTAIGGKGHTCGKSGFEEGEAYPTVHMEAIQKRLFDISDRLVQSLRTKHVRMAELLVPLSMALLTVYDDEYLGIIRPGEEKQDDKSE